MTASVIPERYFVCEADKLALKKAGVSFANLYRRDLEELKSRISLPQERVEDLFCLSQLISLKSVGPSLASMLYAIGYGTLSSLVDANPKEMYEKLNRQFTTHFDPCVEDVFRCAVAQATYAELPKEGLDWWYWTPYRGKSHVQYPLNIITGISNEHS
jgi:hypothetical protein